MNVFSELARHIRNLASTSINAVHEVDRFEAEAHQQPNPNELTQQLSQQYSYPFNQWEKQMFGENMPPIQAHVAWSILEPPKLSNVGTLFVESLYNRSFKSLGYDVQQPTRWQSAAAAMYFSFVQRVTDLFDAAKNWDGTGLFWVPATQVQQDTATQTDVAAAAQDQGSPPTDTKGGQGY
jgi:hypothetical protein